jgi:hypothetical protein
MPERFRPASTESEASRTRVDLPDAVAGRAAAGPAIPVPPRDLPLSYLMEFQSVSEFHAFLEELPEPADADSPKMSLIRIEGLPRTLHELRGLFESYWMEPFLFNPDRFNYLITADMELIRDRDAITNYISSVGRYLREDGGNAAYAAMRREYVDRARGISTIGEALGGQDEFGRMQLGLASPHLTRFLRRLEHDTAEQVSQLTGRTVAVGDIARIECGFREVNGAMVLVPQRAWLGVGPDKGPINIWHEA